MNTEQQEPVRRSSWRAHRDHLHLIGGIDLGDGPSSIAVLDDSSHPRFVPSRTLRVEQSGVVVWIHNEQRRIDRRKEERNMNAFAKLIHAAGRSAVIVGSALAVGCAVVIVANAPAFAPAVEVSQADLVRLDPVVVTISAERFDAIHAEAQRPSMFVRLFSKKPNEV